MVSSPEASEEELEDLLLPHLPPFLPFLPPFLPFLGSEDGAKVVPSSELDSSSSELELHSTDPDSSDSEPLDSLEPFLPLLLPLPFLASADSTDSIGPDSIDSAEPISPEGEGLSFSEAIKTKTHQIENLNIKI